MGRHPFDFHGAVGFVLDTDDPLAVDFFDSEYRTARGDPAPGVSSVHLAWRRTLVPCLNASGSRLHSHKLLARWRYAIHLGEDEITLEAIGNRLALPMVHHMMVHPSLRCLASRRGALLLHGAAVVLGGHSLVLTGPGGMGKTTVSALLLARGGPDWRLHADDYVFLADGPQTLAYLTRSHLYRNLLDWLPDLAPRLTPWERLRLDIFGRIRGWSREGIKWPVRLTHDRLWPGREVAQRADLAAILVLRRSLGAQPAVTRILKDSVPVHDLLEMGFFEARHFQQLVEAAPGSGVGPDWLEAWRQREQRILDARRNDTPFYWLDLPAGSRPDLSIGEQLVDLLEPIVRSGAG